MPVRTDVIGMAAVKRDLVIEKGATFRFNLRLKDSSGDYMDLTDYIGRMQVRETVDDEDVVLDIGGSDFTFDDAGRCRIKVSASRTTALAVTAGVYDLEIEAPNGDVDRLFEGKVKVKLNVTRNVGVAP